MSGPEPILRTTPTLAPDEVAAVVQLAQDAARLDGAHPLGEHVMLHLRHGGGPHSLHLLVEDRGTGAVLGYAHLDLSQKADGPSAELTVSPAARRRGVGTLLIDELVRRADTQPGSLSLWAHGTDAAAGRLAAARGFHRVRRLAQLRRSLLAPLAPVEVPPGMVIRTFDAGRDMACVLDLNALAFTDLPDQGRWTRADLEQRMAEAWFDPAGFLLAEDRDGRLQAFHWTKVHSHGDSQDHDPLGEVYVVGVHPRARGRGLGRAVTLAGLHHLRGLGLASALLYVDSGNTAALCLYQSLGFAPWDTDTLFRR